MTEYQEYDVSEVYRDLAGILGAERVTSSLLERINNAVGVHNVKLDRERLPYAVARPSCAEEVSELVKYANSKRIPIFVRGSGTSLSGASDYRHKGIVLNTSGLKRFEMDVENSFVELGTGHRGQDVLERLEQDGYFFPMHPGSILIATIGGIVCNNTSAHVIDPCKGKPRDYILGVEAVVPTGEILQVGTKSLRRPAGLDLTQLFVGGDGLFGVITNVRMRLEPILANAYGVAFFEDGVRAARAVQRLYIEKVPPPLFLEYLDKKSAEPGFEVQGLDPPPGPLLLFQFIGQREDEAARARDLFLEITRQEKAVEAFGIRDREYWQKIWTARASSGPYATQRKRGLIISAELVSTVGGLVDCYQDAVHMGEDLPTLGKLLPNYLYGHIGALSLHPSFIIPAEWADEEKMKAVGEVFSKEAEINLKYETCGGEWGQTGRRAAFYRKRYGEKNYELIRGMKKVFDPNRILNPDVLPEE
jgi:glycolate oxidase